MLLALLLPTLYKLPYMAEVFSFLLTNIKMGIAIWPSIDASRYLITIVSYHTKKEAPEHGLGEEIFCLSSIITCLAIVFFQLPPLPGILVSASLCSLYALIRNKYSTYIAHPTRIAHVKRGLATFLIGSLLCIVTGYTYTAASLPATIPFINPFCIGLIIVAHILLIARLLYRSIGLKKIMYWMLVGAWAALCASLMVYFPANIVRGMCIGLLIRTFFFMRTALPRFFLA